MSKCSHNVEGCEAEKLSNLKKGSVLLYVHPENTLKDSVKALKNWFRYKMRRSYAIDSDYDRAHKLWYKLINWDKVQ